MTSSLTPGAEVPIPILSLPASTKKVLDMEATMPDELAISKNVSGVVSPKPNLPNEVEAKMNLSVELSWNNTSLLNIQSPVTVSSWDKEAGPPAPQSKEMEASVVSELLKLTVKWAPLKDIDDLSAKLPEKPSLIPMEPAMPWTSEAQENLPVELFQIILLVAPLQEVKPEP